MAGRMAGKTALSSGAASGLGEAQAKVFTQVGVRVSTIFPGQDRTPILGSITHE
jgi:NADP-dependent 3-hydroxy acid dehydrogenase YdfG